MPDDHMLEDLDFESKIRGMPDRELMEFIARQSFSITQRCTEHTRRLVKLESERGPGARIIAGVGGAVGGVVAGLVYGLIVLIRKEV